MDWLLFKLFLIQIFILSMSCLTLLKTGVRGVRLAADLVVIFCLPLVGLVCVCLMEMDRKQTTTNEKKSETDDTWSVVSEYDNKQVRLIRLIPLDVFRETDVAPSDDLLMSADFALRRRYLLDILKESAVDWDEMRRVRTALKNDDLETVHYAASGLQRIRQHFDSHLIQLAAACSAEPDNVFRLKQYADCIDQYLQIIKPEGYVAHQLAYRQIRLLLHLLRIGDLGRVDRLISILNDRGHIRQAEKISRMIFQHAAEKEDKYIALLKFYFSIRDQTGFNRTLTALRASDLVIADETLNMIRLWTGVIQ